MAPTRLRNPNLSSKAARQALDHNQSQVIEATFTAIDQLRAMRDALEAVRENSDPTMTRPARAVRYKAEFSKVSDRAVAVARRQAEMIGQRKEALIAEAYEKAGLLQEPQGANEIRTALRNLSQKERDAAISQALERGDSLVLAAIVHASTPLLTGPTTVPVDTLTKMALDRAVPSLRQELEDLEQAESFLELAYSAFTRDGQQMRDLPSEEQAAEGQKRAKEALEKLAAILRGELDEDGDEEEAEEAHV